MAFALKELSRMPFKKKKKKACNILKDASRSRSRMMGENGIVSDIWRLLGICTLKVW